MASRVTLRDFFWMAAGAILLLAAVVGALLFQRQDDSSARLRSRARRLELVQTLQIQLSLASEAEKSAVMATTDQESQQFADQSRADSKEVARARDQLLPLLSGAAGAESELLGQFSRAFDACQKIDDGLLDLAVENTNLKAYDLAFGPAADALHRMDQALGTLRQENARSSSPESRRVAELAADAECGALRIQALLAPHISEESDEKMNALEAEMAREDMGVHKNLAALGTNVPSRLSGELRTADSAYAGFSDLRRQIIRLSRQNSNVRSLAISLNEKRKALEVCRDALDALARAIQSEPAGASVPASPR